MEVITFIAVMAMATLFIKRLIHIEHSRRELELQPLVPCHDEGVEWLAMAVRKKTGLPIFSLYRVSSHWHAMVEGNLVPVQTLLGDSKFNPETSRIDKLRVLTCS